MLPANGKLEITAMTESLEAVQAAATQALTPFVDPSGFTGTVLDVVLAWQPRHEDFSRVFVAEAAARAEQAYATFWARPAPPLAPRGHSLLEVRVVESGELGRGTPAAQRFPGGFTRIAHLLVPGLVWVAWKYHTPDRKGRIAHHGLVWMGDRFVWFPKPWRFLAG